MMRFAWLAALLLTACSQGTDTGDALVGVYRGPGRDALCITPRGQALEAGLITYGDGDTNCSLNGRATVVEDTMVIAPRGDTQCSVEIRFASGVASLGQLAAACDYYCGPDVSYAGRELRKTPEATATVTDFTGDRLC